MPRFTIKKKFEHGADRDAKLRLTVATAIKANADTLSALALTFVIRPSNHTFRRPDYRPR